MKSVELDARQLNKSTNGVMWVALEVRNKIYLEAFTCRYRMSGCPAQFYRLKKELVVNIGLYPNYLKQIFIKKNLNS